VRQFTNDYTGFDGLDWAAIRTGADTEVSSYHSEDVLRSTFGRVNLSYKSTYFLQASLRNESFSGFGKNEKNGLFPAVSGGVQVAELVDMGPVSSLKVRASYGVTGNLPPSANLALAAFNQGAIIDFDGDPTTSTDQFVSQVASRDPNPGLKWETKTEINFGIDFGLFEDRLTGAIEYYTRNIDDLLYGVNLIQGGLNPFGAVNENGQPVFNIANFAWANVGSISSSGFEFSAAYSDIKLGPVNWTPSFNFTLYDKAVVESFSVGDIGPATLYLAQPGSPGQNNDSMIRNIPGETLGNMYGPVFKGIDENGAYVLENGDTYEDYVLIGNGLPDGEFGFSNTFTMGHWEFNYLLRGAFGHTLYNSYRGFYENRDPGSKTWNSVTTDKTPYVTSSPRYSSLYVEDASFMRLDNASLGYNLPLKSNVFSDFRIYVSGQNLFTITDYAGIDPEVRYRDTENGDSFQSGLAPGIERRNTYFTTRSYSIGLSLRIK
jgi:iron complex outermembrane receptor protein